MRLPPSFGWFAVALYLVCALIFIRWRAAVAHYAGLTLGARVPPGCALVMGVGFLLLALLFYALFVANVPAGG